MQEEAAARPHVGQQEAHFLTEVSPCRLVLLCTAQQRLEGEIQTQCDGEATNRVPNTNVNIAGTSKRVIVYLFSTGNRSTRRKPGLGLHQTTRTIIELKCRAQHSCGFWVPPLSRSNQQSSLYKIHFNCTKHTPFLKQETCSDAQFVRRLGAQINRDHLRHRAGCQMCSNQSNKQKEKDSMYCKTWWW